MLEFEQVVLQVNCQKGKKAEFTEIVNETPDWKTEVLFDKKDGISGAFVVEKISFGKSGWLLLSILLAFICVNSILLKKSVIFSETSKELPVPVVISCAKQSAISKNSFAGIETICSPFI